MITLKEIEETKYFIKQFKNLISTCMLVRCNFIIEAGAYTVTASETNELELVNTLNPMHWSKEGVDEVLSKIKLSNNEGKVLQGLVQKRA